MRRRPRLDLIWEQLELPDGDFVDLCRTPAGAGPVVGVFRGTRRWRGAGMVAHGGHVGFVSGRSLWQPEFWLERRIPAFLADHLQ